MKDQLKIPTRDELLRTLDTANQLAIVWLLVQTVVVLVCVTLIDWPGALASVWGLATAVAVILLEEVRPAIWLWAKRKVEIRDLKETTRFGQFDKHTLKQLYDETLKKLGLPNRHLPVYVTAEKSLNAGAVRLGAFSWLKSLNGIYLHRQVMHRLSPEEVQDIIGHELGHYYRYYLKNQSFTFLPLLVGASGGILLSQYLGVENIPTFCVLGIVFLTYAVSFINGMFWSRTGETIEYLCDDHGAQVNGIYWSISGLLKLGIDAEIQCAISKQAALAGIKGNLSVPGILEAVEEQLPYGVASREEVEKAIKFATQSQAKRQHGASVSGFLQYVWNSDQDESVQNQLETFVKQITALEKAVRVPWETVLNDPRRVVLDEESTRRLVQLIEANPKALLFRLPAEAGAVVDVHPPLKNRVLYLWHNRKAIEAGKYA